MVIVEPPARLSDDDLYLSGRVALNGTGSALAEPLVDLVGSLIELDGELAFRWKALSQFSQVL